MCPSISVCSLRTVVFFSGICHADLVMFLDTNLPKSSKKEKILLGVSDSKLAAAIAEASGTSCVHTGAVPEIIRGEFFYSMFSGENDNDNRLNSMNMCA